MLLKDIRNVRDLLRQLDVDLMPVDLLIRLHDDKLRTNDIIDCTTFMCQRFRTRFLIRNIRHKNVLCVLLNRHDDFKDVTVSRIIMIVDNITRVFKDNNTDNSYVIMLDVKMNTRTRRANRSSGNRSRRNSGNSNHLERILLLDTFVTYVINIIYQCDLLPDKRASVSFILMLSCAHVHS